MRLLLSVAGLVSCTITNANGNLIDFAKAEIEEIIDARRLCDVVDKVDTLAIGLVCGVIDFDIAVELLGGRKPAKEQHRVHQATAFGRGAWGSASAATYVTDVPLAMGHIGEIAGHIWGDGAGVAKGEEAGFGLKQLATEAVAALSPLNTKVLFEDVFKRIGMACMLYRTPVG